MARIVRVGLEEGAKIEPSTLEELLVEFEERIRKAIVSKTKRRLESLDILIKATYKDRKELLIEVDIRAGGKLIAPLSYDELLAEALSEAGAWLEREIRRAVISGNRGSKETLEGEENTSYST